MELKLNDQMEKHLRLCLWLMVLFFIVDYAAEAVFILKVTEEKIGGPTAHDCFLTFMGIAVGIFRGMFPHKEEKSNG